MKDGAPQHKLASLTAEAVNMPPRTIRRWATNAKWQSEDQEDNMNNYEYRDRKLTRQIANDIILEIYVRNSKKDVHVKLEKVITAVSEYHRKHGGILPDTDEELKDATMFGLHDVRHSGYAKKAQNGDTNTMYEWIISPTKNS